jgi:hypothetical protein
MTEGMFYIFCMEHYEANKNEIDMASRGSFLDLTIAEAHKLQLCASAIVKSRKDPQTKT